MANKAQTHKPTVDLIKHQADALAGKLGYSARKAAEARLAEERAADRVTGVR